MPGWNNSDRNSRLPDNWKSIRARILRRDGYQCTAIRDDGEGLRCPEPATDVDHIRPGDDHRDTNLRSLCDWHHRRKSSSEGGRAMQLARQRAARQFNRSEAHPGSL
jgi:5-methylcytosine-specific restriction protein A